MSPRQHVNGAGLDFVGRPKVDAAAGIHGNGAAAWWGVGWSFGEPSGCVRAVKLLKQLFSKRGIQAY